MNSSSDASGDVADQTVREWFALNIGPVTHIERQARWRPGWLVSATVDGQEHQYYVRGSRGGYWPPLPLSYEAEVQRYFNDSGLRSPRLLGYIDEIPAIVMDVVAGQPDLSTAREADRDALRRQLAEQMAFMHGLDPQHLHACGAPTYDSDLRRTNGYLDQVEQLFRAAKQVPEPCIEFVLGWLGRNAPTNACAPTVIAVDAGQFMFDGADLTAMIDFELVSVGDRFTDLGALRTRNRAEPLGDLDEFFALYEQASGVPLDMPRIRYHGIGLSMLCPMMISGTLSNPTDDADYHEYLTWKAFSLKDALEQIAEARGIALAAPEPLPTRAGKRFSPLFKALEQSVAKTPAGNDYLAYQLRKQALVIRFLEKLDRHQDDLDRRYLDDIARVTGQLPLTALEGDRVLEAFVLESGGADEEALLGLFYRQYHALSALLADPDDGPNKYAWLTEPIAPIGASA